MKGNVVIGATYLLRGAKLLTQPTLRLFVLIPLLINIVLFSVLVSLSLMQFDAWITALIDWLPGFLDFLSWILWPIAVIFLLVVVMYSFSVVANLIAAPFNGLLAEKVEELLTGEPVSGKETIGGALRDFPRAFIKECAKLLYYLRWALGVLIISLLTSWWLPFIPPVLWFLLGAWMMAVEYGDYPMENHKYTLPGVKQALRDRRATSLGFGSAAMLGTMVPVVNFFIMPAAVCGATIYWVEELGRAQAIGNADKPSSIQ